MTRKIFRYVGIAGTVACLLIFIRRPSWPTPDKLLVLITFVFMSFGQAWSSLKRLVPFVGLLLVYESFRGLVPSLNSRVHYDFMILADRGLFGGTLPTTTLQNWLWHGAVQWYDFVFYLAYMLHFILPIGLAIMIWKTRVKYYWRYVTTFLVVSFSGFVTFLLFPAAPPWMAADQHLIESVVRVSSHVWYALGIHDFPSLYNRISPNPVAAVPSLHAAYATLIALFVYKFFGKKWALLASVYPLLIYVGTVYQGEHYAIDEIIGGIYAVVVFFAVDYFWQKRLKNKIHTSEKSPFGGS